MSHSREEQSGVIHDLYTFSKVVGTLIAGYWLVGLHRLTVRSGCEDASWLVGLSHRRCQS